MESPVHPSRPESDHRRLGRQMSIFAAHELLGAGLPIWLPSGAIVRRELEEYVLSLERRAGYQHVYSPPLAKRELYEISGHWDHYEESMFPPMRMPGHDEGSSDADASPMGGKGEEMVLRPMNCPHHILVFQHESRSYRDLPLRIAELGQMFRNENSGSVGGLSRVRCMTLNDGHVFLMPDQIDGEVAQVLRLIKEAYEVLGLGEVSYRLSLRGPGGKYVQDDQLWNDAEDALRRCLVRSGSPFVEASNEADFYGPKIDVQVQGHSGKEETLSTVQLDFHLPQQFGLQYVGSDGVTHRPVMLHRSIISTMERMTAFLLEKHEGRLPLWLAPEQVRVLPVSDAFGEYAKEVNDLLLARSVRSKLDAGSPLGARISLARKAQLPYSVVVGEKEVASRSVTVRIRGLKEQVNLPLEVFLPLLAEKLLLRAGDLSF